ncbi:MAG: hypothetical protein AAB399_00795 [Patescibacteria group bacterium]
MALTYLIQRFFYRIAEFFRHWYVKSFRVYSNFVFDELQKMDRTLAWRVNVRYLFQPLYKDYSIIGYILGFILRFGRLLGTSFIYLVVFAFVIAVYIVWLMIPVALILRIFYFQTP